MPSPKRVAVTETRAFRFEQADDPYEVPGAQRQLARARSRRREVTLRRRVPLAAGGPWSPPDAKTEAFRYRPLPIAYLKTLPALRYETPDIWLAVSEHPRDS
jgi:hypothetical protein